MAARARRHQELDRYLLEGERLVAAVHQHWAKMAEPVATAVVGVIVALWVDATITHALAVVSTIAWWAWFALLARMLYRLAEWRHDWFVATDKRLLLFYGFVTRRVSMMPLSKVTDMSYERSVPGRLLGYGRFVMESAGQEQALHKVNWVPEPDRHYRAICAEIFGVPGRPDELGDDDPWDDGLPPLPALPDPYAGWDDPRHRRTGSPSLYRSPDLRARDRSADTGPIPVRPRRDWNDDKG